MMRLALCILLLAPLQDESRTEFWSFRPLRRTEGRDSVDAFILARLETQGLKPNGSADRRTLIRRATFDLIGLPPTPEEVEAFVNNADPKAYDRLIDRLLKSPHFGERWARHWLDVTRFAESHGFEHDYDRKYAYHYRDFVIKALNRDMPYDQFVRWQLAGDEIAPEEPLALMATGFLGAGVFPTQLTEKEFESARYDEMDDMVSTLGTGMLGLTIGCARCHDHKYDPIPSSDYYRLLSTFTTTIRSEVDVVLNPKEHKAARARFDAAHKPYVRALKRFETDRLPDRLAKWEASRPKKLPPGWEILDLRSYTSGGDAKFKRLPDGSLLVSGTNARFDTYTLVALTDEPSITAVRVEALADASMAKRGPGRAANGNFCLTDLKVTAAPLKGKGEPVQVKLARARATFEQKGLPVRNVIDANRKSGWAVDPKVGRDHAAVFEFSEPVGFDGGTLLTITLDFQCNTGHNVGRPRLSVTGAPRPVPLELTGPARPIAEILKIKKSERTGEQVTALFDWYRMADPEWRRLHKAMQDHLGTAPRPNRTRVMVCSEGIKPPKHHADDRGYPHFYKKTYFLNRGDTGQKQGEATQSFLTVLMKAREGAKRWRVAPPDGARTSYRRTALANWITDTEAGAGHLLARVIVNRLWQHHFGRGLVATPNDFGARGTRPTHPDLLDWLATELIQNGWRLKPIHRLIVTSAAYRRSSRVETEMQKIDPANATLWRRSPRRLEGEIIRDSMLAVSGSLDRRMFGPGTLSEKSRRRSIYFTIKRSKLIPMMTAFDAPEPLTSIGRRGTTTVAPQALLLMNSPHVRAWAVSFAGRLDAQSLDAAVEQGTRIALGRSPTSDELKDFLTFLEEQIKSYPDAKTARGLALADFCQVLMSLNEFVYVD